MISEIKVLIRLFGENYISLFLLAGLLIIFRKNARVVLNKRKNILLTVACVFAIMVFEIAELYCAQNPALKNWRVLSSVLGYCTRPMVGMCFLSMIVDLRQKQYYYFWIPAILNTLVFCTAFFSKLTFWYDDEYDFHRGPLGYFVFLVSYFYIVWVVIETVKCFKTGQRWRGGIVLVGAIGCSVAPIVESIGNIQHLLCPTMLISVLIYYLYLYSEYLSRDMLTGLWKRDIFYQDAERVKERISSIILLEINGLKDINNNQGHEAGDAVLATIAKEIKSLSDESTWVYRMGGDEFSVICLDKDERSINELILVLKAKGEMKGYSLAAGYSMMEEGIDVETMLLEAGERLYEDKNQYYLSNHMDRRNRL